MCITHYVSDSDEVLFKQQQNVNSYTLLIPEKIIFFYTILIHNV